MEPPADEDPPVPPTLPPTPPMHELDEATAVERDAVRRMVDAGASSPEDLRALAEKIREQREAEQQAWEEQVKPSLQKAKKRRPQLADLRTEADAGRKEQRRFLAIAGVAVLMVLLVLTWSSAPLVLIAVLLAGLLAYAYVTGRSGAGADAADDAGDEPPPAATAEGEPEV